MKKIIDDLKQLAEDIRLEDQRMSGEVCEGGREAERGQQQMLRAIHRLHQMLLLIPDKLVKIAEGLENSQ